MFWMLTESAIKSQSANLGSYSFTVISMLLVLQVLLGLNVDV